MRTKCIMIGGSWLVAATLWVSAAPPVELSNDRVAVQLYPDRPAVKRCLHKATGQEFAGAGEDGQLMINGEPIPWHRFEIKTTPIAGAGPGASQGLEYHMALSDQALSFDMTFELRDAELVFQVLNIRDPERKLKTIGWQNLPLLVCTDSEYHYWWLTTAEPDASSGGKMWMRDARGQIKTSRAEAGTAGAILGCLWRDDRLCAFAHSNYPLFPVTRQITAEKQYAIGLNTYQYRVRHRTMPPLQAQVVFLSDQNGDGRTDLSDYRLWVNRRLPDTDPLYRTHIWYKILNQEPTAGVRSTFKQAEEIIRAVHHVTDGLPQMIYLVGWQYEGHDTGYPAMDKVNTAIGGEAGLRALINVSKEDYNTLISYHCNIDDTYPGRPAYDPTIVADNGNISHCLDVESGKIFRRLEAMMRVAPVERTIHFDNARITSRVAAQGIGILEELECGLRPIDAYLKARGITMTTEGQNGIPIALPGLFSAIWHYDPPLSSMQIWHRKLMGGGWGSHMGPQTRFELGLGSSIHQDVSYLPVDREALGEEVWKKHFSWMNGPRGLTVSFTKDWDDLVERIYLGTLLYQFYLERELTAVYEVPGGVRQVYNNGEVVAENANNHLHVTLGEVTVADDDERFIPRGGAIYAYSVAGSEREWRLPAEFRGKSLKAYSLSKDGRGPSPTFKVESDRIRLKLLPRTPVKIVPSKP
ncbi:MAG: endo-alpha-N-acetylgalactosaminidase family protein [Verrucomicrobiia bacterium]